MQALGPSAVGEVLDDARGHAAGNAQGVADLCPVLAHGGGNAGRRAKAAENGGRVEAGRVHRLLRDEAEAAGDLDADHHALRSEEHTSELPSLMRNSYAVFFLKKKT